MKKIRILSLDGGGIRGILPGTLLSYIEAQLKEQTGNPKATIGQYFDFVAGTSTGGILSLTCVCPDDNGNYKFSAAQALDLYLKRGNSIFDLDLKQRIQSLGGLLDEKYSADALEDALHTYFGETKLSQALKPCLLTSYDIRNRKAYFFTSADASTDQFDFYFKDVARATAAAPTYFEPAYVRSVFGTPHALIDGGVFANNPALCAYAEARTTNFSTVLANAEKPNKPTASQMMIVSIGTGGVKKTYPYDDFKDAGMVKWIKPLIDIMMSGNSETVDYQLRQIYDTLSAEDSSDYYRIQPILEQGDPDMDNAEPENLKALHEDGLQSVELYKSELNDIVKKLIAYH